MKAAQIIAAVFALACLGSLAYCAQRRLTNGLPPKAELPSLAAAHAAALTYSHEHGGAIVPVLGTGSMAPFIPPAREGLDPRKTVVAYAVTNAGATFADIQPGALCIYVADWNGGAPIMHQAAQLDSGGWIMTGLANAHSETWARVTAQNFRGIVAKVFTWSQE